MQGCRQGGGMALQFVRMGESVEQACVVGERIQNRQVHETAVNRGDGAENNGKKGETGMKQLRVKGVGTMRGAAECVEGSGHETAV